MSKLYDDVKKQGEQIDDLQKTVTNHTTRIETLETKAKARPPQTQAMPSEVKVVLPDDIARKSDIEEAVTKITRKCNAGDSRTPQPVTVTVSALDALEKVEFDKAIRKAVKDEIQNNDKKVVENNAILKRIENRQNSSENETALRNKLNAFKIGFVINVVVFIAFGVMFLHQDNEIEHLKRVEWLYRWSRIGRTDTEEYQDFERRMLDGKKEEREGMKAKIFNMERNSPQFLYFRPVDDWKPETPEPEKSKSESKEEDSGGWFDWITRKTPQEEAALRDVRNNPNIPEGAKP